MFRRAQSIAGLASWIVGVALLIAVVLPVWILGRILGPRGVKIRQLSRSLYRRISNELS